MWKGAPADVLERFSDHEPMSSAHNWPSEFNNALNRRMDARVQGIPEHAWPKGAFRWQPALPPAAPEPAWFASAPPEVRADPQLLRHEELAWEFFAANGHYTHHDGHRTTEDLLGEEKEKELEICWRAKFPKAPSMWYDAHRRYCAHHGLHALDYNTSPS